MKKLFWAMYIVLVIGLVVVGKKAVVYVNNVLEEYEASQPEQLVEEQLVLLKEAGKNNTLENMITFPELELAEYRNLQRKRSDISDIGRWGACCRYGTGKYP